MHRLNITVARRLKQFSNTPILVQPQVELKAPVLTHPCPATGRTKGSCPDYIIDHIKPLACGGADEATNMQWQTKVEAKIKDKWERRNCK